MGLRIVLIASGIIAILFGLLLALQPDQAILNFQLGESSSAARLFARSEGAALMAVGIMNILASGSRASLALRAIVLTNLLLHISGILTDFTESFPKTGGWWVGFAVHVIFILGFGYYFFNWGKVAKA